MHGPGGGGGRFRRSSSKTGCVPASSLFPPPQDPSPPSTLISREDLQGWGRQPASNFFSRQRLDPRDARPWRGSGRVPYVRRSSIPFPPGRRNPIRNPELYTKLRVLVRSLLKCKPKPEEGGAVRPAAPLLPPCTDPRVGVLGGGCGRVGRNSPLGFPPTVWQGDVRNPTFFRVIFVGA